MQPIKRDYFQFEQDRTTELKTKAEEESEWPKFLGELTLKAFVIGTLTRKIRVGKRRDNEMNLTHELLGDSVLLAREKPLLTNIKKTKKEQKASANASVIRVVHDDQEIGKLENIFAVTLGALLDKNYIFLDAEVLNPPSDWNYFSPFTLKAKVIQYD